MQPVSELLVQGGPFRSYVGAVQKAFPGKQLELVLTGGGSQDKEFEKEVKKIYPGAAFETMYNDESFVALDGVLALADSDICDDKKITNKSYGIVYTARYDGNNKHHRARKGQAKPVASHITSNDISGEKELDNTAFWMVHKGGKVSPDTRHLASHVLYLLRKQVPSQVKKPLVFARKIIETSFEELGGPGMSGIKADSPGIEDATILRFQIDLELAERIGRDEFRANHGFTQHGKRKPWQLEFDYELRHRRAGMLQFFEIRIPYGGYFPPRRTPRNDEMHIERFQLLSDCKTAAEYGDQYVKVEDGSEEV